jgi:CheY-like chemotaxis protein
LARVLAFEDSYDIGEMLKGAEVRMGHFEQRWSSENAVEVLKEFGRVDVLLLDFYLPPVTGLMVLEQVNEAVKIGVIQRPKHVVGMSSVSSCNSRLICEGADAGFVKWDIGTWEGWARDRP